MPAIIILSFSHENECLVSSDMPVSDPFQPAVATSASICLERGDFSSTVAAPEDDARKDLENDTTFRWQNVERMESEREGQK